MNRNYSLAILGILILGWMTLLGSVYPELPDRIPVHFDASGTPDGWGKKATIWILPVITVVISLALILLPGFAPRSINYPVPITAANADRQFKLVVLFMTVLSFMVTLLMMYATWTMVAGAHAGVDGGFEAAYVWIFMVIIFAWIGVYIWKAKSLK